MFSFYSFVTVSALFLYKVYIRITVNQYFLCGYVDILWIQTQELTSLISFMLLPALFRQSINAEK